MKPTANHVASKRSINIAPSKHALSSINLFLQLPLSSAWPEVTANRGHVYNRIFSGSIHSGPLVLQLCCQVPPSPRRAATTSSSAGFLGPGVQLAHL